MKIYKSILKVIIIMLITLTCFNNISYVYAGSEHGGGGHQREDTQQVNPIENPDFYEPTDKGGNEQFIEMGNIIIGTIRAVGTIIAVIALMVIGLRYMFGSTAERANYKETMIPYLIGAVMIFTIPNILGIIFDLVKEIKF